MNFRTPVPLQPLTHVLRPKLHGLPSAHVVLAFIVPQPRKPNRCETTVWLVVLHRSHWEAAVRRKKLQNPDNNCNLWVRPSAWKVAGTCMKPIFSVQVERASKDWINLPEASYHINSCLCFPSHSCLFVLWGGASVRELRVPLVSWAGKGRPQQSTAPPPPMFIWLLIEECALHSAGYGFLLFCIKGNALQCSLRKSCSLTIQA